MASRLTTEQMKASAATRGGQSNFKKTQYVEFKVSKDQERCTKRLRFIGLPVTYWEFRAEKRKVEGDNKSPWVATPFIDDHFYTEYKKPTRIGWLDAEDVAKRGVCPWAKLGYHAGQKYAIVVIERGENGAPDAVKVLNKGSQLFVKCLTEWEFDEENDGGDICKIGGEVAYDFNLTAKYDSAQPLMPIWKIKPIGKPSKISDNDLELLKEAFMPTAEEYENFCTEDPSLRNFPEWYTWGVNLSRLYAPTPVLTEEKKKGNTSVAAVDAPKTKVENVIFNADDEDEEEEKSPRRPVQASPVVNKNKSANPFDDVDNNDPDDLNEVPDF